jgi:hypothetical protein
MTERWVASSWLLTEKRLRDVDGHQDLSSLATILGREPVQRRAQKRASGAVSIKPAGKVWEP